MARPTKGSKFRQAARPVVYACLRPFLLSLRSSALLASLFVLRCLFPSAVSRLTLSMTEFELFGRIKIGQVKTPVLFLPLCRALILPFRAGGFLPCFLFSYCRHALLHIFFRQSHLASLACKVHIYDALIGASAKQKRQIFLLRDKSSVHQEIYL